MKVFGIGLNKTGTKTLGHYLRQLGFRHRSYDSPNVTESPSFRLWQAGKIPELVDLISDYDSCEDWPWPLLYRELDEQYPDARFVLTLRRSSDAWYRSLCNMAVRIGPLPLYEKHVYGSGMPHGRKKEHIAIYDAHTIAVERYFEERPEKLLKVSWDAGDSPSLLADFLGRSGEVLESTHVNRSPSRVYQGDNLMVAHMARLNYQWIYGPQAPVRGAVRSMRNQVRRLLP